MKLVKGLSNPTSLDELLSLIPFPSLPFASLLFRPVAFSASSLSHAFVSPFPLPLCYVYYYYYKVFKIISWWKLIVRNLGEKAIIQPPGEKTVFLRTFWCTDFSFLSFLSFPFNFLIMRLTSDRLYKPLFFPLNVLWNFFHFTKYFSATCFEWRLHIPV